MDIDNLDLDELNKLANKITKRKRSLEFPKTTTMYMHRSKEENYELAHELKLPEDALAVFRYTGYEVPMTIEVTEKGEVFLIAVKDVYLVKRVQI